MLSEKTFMDQFNRFYTKNKGFYNFNTLKLLLDSILRFSNKWNTQKNTNKICLIFR